jgi:hypothetical protein
MPKGMWMGSLSTTNVTSTADFGHIAAKFQPVEEDKITAN